MNEQIVNGNFQLNLSQNENECKIINVLSKLDINKDKEQIKKLIDVLHIYAVQDRVINCPSIFTNENPAS